MPWSHGLSGADRHWGPTTVGIASGTGSSPGPKCAPVGCNLQHPRLERVAACSAITRRPSLIITLDSCSMRPAPLARRSRRARYVPKSHIVPARRDSERAPCGSVSRSTSGRSSTVPVSVMGPGRGQSRAVPCTPWIGMNPDCPTNRPLSSGTLWTRILGEAGHARAVRASRRRERVDLSTRREVGASDGCHHPVEWGAVGGTQRTIDASDRHGVEAETVHAMPGVGDHGLVDVESGDQRRISTRVAMRAAW